MKSKKAEKYLSENGLGYPYTGYATEQVAKHAVELAEQEAEERMRQKAIEAYRRSCSCGESTCNSCALMRRFIQKLTE